jgi:hypothetical protein
MRCSVWLARIAPNGGKHFAFLDLPLLSFAYFVRHSSQSRLAQGFDSALDYR